MTFLSRHYWQLALIGSGLLSAIGGGLHPDVSAEGSTTREELAEMTADSAWVPGHTLLALGVALLALGLWGARRSGRWAGADSALRWGFLAVSLYFLEAVTHTAAVVDSENLAHGHSAPVATAHLALAAFLYPLSGAAFVWVASAVGAHWGRLRLLSVLGIIGGCVHAVVVPATLLLTDTETTPLFAIAGMTLAAWSVATGLIGVARPTRRRSSSVAAVREPVG